MDILNCHCSAQGATANGQVYMAPVQFDQCAAFAFVCKNRTESIHQQTLRKKQPLGAWEYPIEPVYLGERGVKIEKRTFTTVEISKINKICYTWKTFRTAVLNIIKFSFLHFLLSKISGLWIFKKWSDIITNWNVIFHV